MNVRKIKHRLVGLVGLISPKLVARLWYFYFFRKHLNLQNPRNINEKIQWLKFYSDTSMWTLLADKYKVRDFVKERGCGDLLTRLYGVWKRSEEIDFDSLPNSFVLKTNNFSGEVILVEDKSRIDVNTVKYRLDQWLSSKKGIETAELHYLTISPCIIAEEYLKQDSSLSSSLIDYKFYCFNGEPYCAMVCYDRVIGEHAVKMIYDLEKWMPRIDCIKKGYEDERVIPRPKSYERMLSACRILAAGFPMVRMDFYEVDGKPYFGEFTFTPAGGFINCLTPEFLLELGGQLHLPTKKQKKQL